MDMTTLGAGIGAGIASAGAIFAAYLRSTRHRVNGGAARWHPEDRAVIERMARAVEKQAITTEQHVAQSGKAAEELQGMRRDFSDLAGYLRGRQSG